ncbi:SDR family NAD(P)-dependent oxidoreductase [Massilia sp. DWR3-1-1]|uniref:SDR family NAD(P)-dependent oxidoreductase n=1 Tax=Massilia sp. DWR3-1-1 TaxID=2804559 RepID=UPI003CF004D2
MTDHPFHLRDKRILVTGASSGIGRAIAIECARAGATVIASARDVQRLADTMAAMGEGEHISMCADLADAGQMAALVARAGAIDGVVHAAGIQGLTPMRMMRQSFLDQVIGTNFMAPAMLTQKLLAAKSLRNGASIVFLSSIAAHTGTVGVGAYSSSKGAIEGLMRVLALETAPRAMRVNALAPGLIDTPLVNGDRAFLEEKGKAYPLGLGQPEDVAYAAIYLLCDASRKVSGISLHLDGGIPWT